MSGLLIRHDLRDPFPGPPRTLARMVEACRCLCAPEITEERFPIRPERYTTAGLELVSFSRRVTTQEVLGAFTAHALQPACIEELLAFGALHAAMSQEHQFVAFGSALKRDDGRAIGSPALSGNHERRVLNVAWGGLESGWSERWMFLVKPLGFVADPRYAEGRPSD